MIVIADDLVQATEQPNPYMDVEQRILLVTKSGVYKFMFVIRQKNNGKGLILIAFLPGED